MESGIFYSFWEEQPNHLPFLNLMEKSEDGSEFNLSKSISILYAILDANTDEKIKESIKELLTVGNWRPHLVAAISILKIDMEKRESLIDLFWERIYKGTWISPQILVVLSIIDKDFMSKAIRLKDGIDVSNSKFSTMEHYEPRGSEVPMVGDKKMIASINYLLNIDETETNDEEEGWIITKNWKDRLHSLAESKRIIIKGW